VYIRRAPKKETYKTPVDFSTRNRPPGVFEPLLLPPLSLKPFIDSFPDLVVIPKTFRRSIVTGCRNRMYVTTVPSQKYSLYGDCRNYSPANTIVEDNRKRRGGGILSIVTTPDLSSGSLSETCLFHSDRDHSQCTLRFSKLGLPRFS